MVKCVKKKKKNQANVELSINESLKPSINESLKPR